MEERQSATRKILERLNQDEHLKSMGGREEEKRRAGRRWKI